MKRFNRSDSFSSLLFPPEEGMNPKEECGYGREFQAMLDGLEGEEDSVEETGQSCENKKRRLSNHQVKSLEKIFEVDNKLDPERKLQLAQDLGLQPRQVAIWFQNRRARWKTKQLERDYSHLKANYEALKLNYHELEQEKETMIAELTELKAKIAEERTQTNEFLTKEKEALFLGSNFKNNIVSKESPFEQPEEPEPKPTKTNDEVFPSLNLDKTNNNGLVDLRDGVSDSDSSGILNEETSTNLSGQLLISLPPPRFDFSSLYSPSLLNYGQFLDSRAVLSRSYQQQMVKMEEQCLVTSSEESCNIFSVDQAPNLCWYFPDQRN